MSQLTEWTSGLTRMERRRLRRMARMMTALAVIVSMIAMITVTAVVPGRALATKPGGGHFNLEFLDVEYDYDQQGNPISTWRYRLHWDGQAPELSHLTIGVCADLGGGDLVDSDPAGATLGKDGSSEIWGVKWDWNLFGSGGKKSSIESNFALQPEQDDVFEPQPQQDGAPDEGSQDGSEDVLGGGNGDGSDGGSADGSEDSSVGGTDGGNTGVNEAGSETGGTDGSENNRAGGSEDESTDGSEDNSVVGGEDRTLGGSEAGSENGFQVQTVQDRTVDVSFTVRGHWQQDQRDYIAKAGSNKEPTGKVTAPGCDPVQPPSGNGKLIIKKYKDLDGDGRKDNNEGLLGGATFRVTGPNNYDVIVKDDQHPDENGSDGIIELRNLAPGLYTVEEIEAPQGWMIDGTATRQVQVSDGDPAIVTFHDPKAPDPGKLIIKKYKDDDGDGNKDKNGLLGGATFRVTGPNNYGVTVEDNQSPDADNTQGVIELRGLLPGSYTIAEIAAPSGYIALGDEQAVEVKSNKTTTVEFLNEKQGVRATLVIRKYGDKDFDGPNSLLGGASFRVCRKVEGPDQCFTITDNATDGEHPDEDPADGVIKLTGLKPGNYEIEETQAPAGYQRDTRKPDVQLKNGETKEVAFNNKRDIDRPAILIYKYGDDGDGQRDAGDELLGGATFRFEWEECVWNRERRDCQTRSFDVTDDISDRDLDKRPGIILVDGLDDDEKYTVYEVTPPTGWMADTHQYTDIDLKKDEVRELQFLNTRKPGTLIIKKYDGGKLLGGATFLITGPSYPSGLTVRDGGENDSDGAANGRIELTGLEWGEYTVKETAAPQGYELDPQPQQKTIGATQLTITFTFVNTPKDGLLRIYKEDAKGQSLGGAQFRVTGPDGYDETFSDDDGDGVIEVTGLKWGTYEITETRAPEGYNADPEPKQVTIGATALEVSVTFVNTPRQTPPPPRSSGPRVDLAVVKEVDDPTPDEGQVVTFIIAVTNEGPDDAENVVLRDLMPAGLTYVAHSASQGTFDPATGRWVVGDLADGESATLTVQALVEAGTAGQTLVNTIVIEDSDPVDRNPNNNRDTAEVTPPSALVIEEEPPAAAPPLLPPLPITGGNSLALLLLGVVALGAGLYLRRHRA